ncbi:hypothetical protein EYF80_044966 [Liparis tanakae]|uniref:Uncharacterized protein n=1 Tax=Liparis tanakae TaxID=230148 RepID=A0A4Z2FU70_9TELE|nr:hypothetical protein EYF80_044966 [Liparis tanakae]
MELPQDPIWRDVKSQLPETRRPTSASSLSCHSAAICSTKLRTFYEPPDLRPFTQEEDGVDAATSTIGLGDILFSGYQK